MPGDRAPAAGLSGVADEQLSVAPSDLRYEQAISQLEAVVARLEGGELPLEDALRLFERGVALARHCAAQLDAAERQVEILSLDDEGRPVLRPLPLAEEGA